MPTHFLKNFSLILFLICSWSYAQNIKELYLEKFKSDWKLYENKSFLKKSIDTSVVYKLESGRSIEEELLYQAKANHKDKASLLELIFSTLKINLKEFDSLAFIQHRSLNQRPPFSFVRKGAIIGNGQIYGFRYDLRDLKKDQLEIQQYNYFLYSENKHIEQVKHIIKNLIFLGRTHHIDSIAKVEGDMLVGPLKELTPETEFEILIYNKRKERVLRRMYLHDTFGRVMNQK